MRSNIMVANDLQQLKKETNVNFKQLPITTLESQVSPLLTACWPGVEGGAWTAGLLQVSFPSVTTLVDLTLL